MVVNAQEVKTDYTDAIVNAAVTSTESWNADGASYGDGLVKFGSGKVFDFNQSITLPAGQYKVAVQAAYRYGSGAVNVAEQAEYDAIQAGTETHFAKLYAETATKKYEANVQNRYEGASETDYFGNPEKVSTVNGLFVPNSSAAVKAWFDNGKYVNELVFNVPEDGQVKIGIAKTESPEAGDYTNIGAWTLTRLGDAQEEQVDDVVFTMVQNEADLVAGEKYLIMAEVNGGWVALSDLYAKTPCYNPSDTLAVSENWTVVTVPATAVSDSVGLFVGAPYMLTLEGEAGAWKFKDEVNGAYLYWDPISKNTLSNDAAGSTFAISFNKYAHNAVIELAETAGRTLQYNSTDPRFACYTSTQAPVYLFKAGEVSVAPVAPSNPSFTSIGELLAFEVGNVVELTLSNAKITYLQGNNMSITDGVDTIAVYDYNIPAEFAVDALLNGKITATLAEYKGNKQLTVVDWSEVKVGAAEMLEIELDKTAAVGVDVASWNAGGLCATQYAPAVTTADGRNAQMVEKYETTVATVDTLLIQTVTGLENGTYTVVLYANAFFTSDRGFESTLTDGATDVVYVFANGKTTPVVAAIATETTANGEYTLAEVEVTDGTLTMGLAKSQAGTNWHTIQIKSLTLHASVDKASVVALYNAAKAEAEALLAEKMSAEAYAALQAALAIEVDENSGESLIAGEAALKEAVNAAKSSISYYADNKLAIDAMYALMESTNVYSAEAFLAYRSIADNYKAQYEAGTLVGAVDNPAAIHGWHASVDYDDLLLSLWGTKDYDSNLYINTWSTEGETDGSEFKVPFFEYWTGDDASLGATTKSALVPGLVPGEVYQVEAWVRVRAKNGVDAADATGITLSVGDGQPVDVTDGELTGTPQMSHARYKAIGAADEDGNLTISFNVLEDNNISWLSFKDLKYSVSACRNVYNVEVADVKVGDWTTETLVGPETIAEIVETLSTPASELIYQLVDTTGVRTDYNGNPGEVLFWVDLDGNHSNWGVNNKFFLSYDSVAQTITSTQMGVAEGDVLNATVRLANAEGKYVEINIVESIFVSPILNIADYEVVSTIKVEAEDAVGVEYSGVTATFDAAAAATALGLSSLAEAEQYILNVTTGNLVSNTTDGWRDANGDAAAWGAENGVCVKINEPASGLVDFIGQMPGATYTAGQTYTAKWAFVHEGKAVVIEVVITFVDGSGIENLATDETVTVYTIGGRAIQTTVGGVDALEKGIYIVNGKKVYVK